ncbi:MAG: hypothetical protein WBP41_08055, partial [Saprospiraceae bacterium]
MKLILIKILFCLGSCALIQLQAFTQEIPSNIGSIKVLSSNIQLEPNEFDDVELCGTDYHHAYLMKTDSIYRIAYLRQMSLVDSVISSENGSRSSLPPQYTIPVVVHVIHLGEPIGTGSNISDAQINDAINGLNARFANTIGAGLNIEINFCLATRSPEGCPTTGINRVNGSGVPNYTANGISVSSFQCGADEHAIKDLSRWSPLEYYNIWVVHNICGGWSGFAYFPWGGPYD